jgi:hypothetical protein
MKYTIIKNQGSCGICGYIWQVLRVMWHYPNNRHYVDFNEGCSYQDKSIKETSNVWEYYFEQPSCQLYPEADQIELVINQIIHNQESEFRDVFMYNPTLDYINNRRKEFNEIIKKYIKLKKPIADKIESFIESYFKGKKVLGVHFRGTDHPDKKDVVEYLQIIKEKAASYDVIFCASDEASRFNLLKTVFGDKVISYDSIRSEDGAPLHYNNSVSKYKIGEDVIIEAFLLANTNFLFCCSNSNVNYLSRAINPTLESIAL